MVDAARINAVLSSPEHLRGLGEHELEVHSVKERFPWLTRVTGRVLGQIDPSSWEHPNLAVRLSVPDDDDTLGPITGQPGFCRRVYTIAAFDPSTLIADIDIVVHGSTSPMMRWLDSLRPGDRVPFAGPRPHAAPTAGQRINLFADGSAYPAASAIARAMQVDTVTLAVPHGQYQSDFPGAEIRFADQTPLSEAPIPTGLIWAAGEREDIRALRGRCLNDRGLPKDQVQVFGYWRRGKTGTDADLARLDAAARFREEGRSMADTDDFDIEI